MGKYYNLKIVCNQQPDIPIWLSCEGHFVAKEYGRIDVNLMPGQYEYRLGKGKEKSLKLTKDRTIYIKPEKGQNMYTRTVREFTKHSDPNIPNVPTKMSEGDKNFLIEMVNDELQELVEADTIVDQADALVDAIYYICDMAVRKGINLDPLFNAVHDANMRKVVLNKISRRDDGKILKPVNWYGPEEQIKSEIKRQSEEGSF